MGLLNKKVAGSLQDGQYNVLLVGAIEIPAKDGIDERVQLKVHVTELNRTIDITMFEQQLDFLVRDLINVYFPNQSMSLPEIIDELDGQSIPMWVARKTIDDLVNGGTKTFINYYWHAPQVVAPASVPVNGNDDTPLPFK